MIWISLDSLLVNMWQLDFDLFFVVSKMILAILVVLLGGVDRKRHSYQSAEPPSCKSIVVEVVINFYNSPLGINDKIGCTSVSMNQGGLQYGWSICQKCPQVDSEFYPYCCFRECKCVYPWNFFFFFFLVLSIEKTLSKKM